jgi:DNA integrity scanning protein DisA with diadenylate cyclase activity
MGMDRKQAVQILEDVEKTVKHVVDGGYSLDSFTPAHIIMQVSRSAQSVLASKPCRCLRQASSVIQLRCTQHSPPSR